MVSKRILVYNHKYWFEHSKVYYRWILLRGKPSERWESIKWSRVLRLVFAKLNGSSTSLPLSVFLTLRVLRGSTVWCRWKEGTQCPQPLAVPYKKKLKNIYILRWVWDKNQWVQCSVDQLAANKPAAETLRVEAADLQLLMMQTSFMLKCWSLTLSCRLHRRFRHALSRRVAVAVRRLTQLQDLHSRELEPRNWSQLGLGQMQLQFCISFQHHWSCFKFEKNMPGGWRLSAWLEA